MGSGRPSEFTQEVADEICARLAAGESLREVCRDENMPDRGTVVRWAQKDETFRGQYAQARERLMERWAEEIIEICDDGSNDYMERRDGTTVVNQDHVQRSRLRVDTRKWLMSKLAPRKYGDKVELSGPDGGPLIVKWAEPAVDDAPQNEPPIGGLSVDKPKT